MTPKAGGEVIVMSKEVLEYVAGTTRLCIAGPSTSGKTSLAKTLYGDFLRRKQLVPILLQPEDIRGANPAQVQASVSRAFERQYAKRLLERFNQLDRESRVVILDDWHAVGNLNAKGKALVLEYLGSKFGRVIVLTDDASVLHQMAEAMAARGVSGFEYCDIRQFGFRLRGELITKWETLGREFELEELELTHKISENEYLLDKLISKGIAPAFPFFIFSVLQADQLITPNSSYGSYGHIYQALLTARMARVNAKNLGLKFRYLSMIAFQMFQSGQDSIKIAELKVIHQRYETEYMVSIDQSKLLSELEEGQVLTSAHDSIRFKYKYGYYYFVAEYLHDGISNVKDAEALRQKLKELADSAYNEQNAHILIFYLYMSKDRPLMEHILSNAQKLFASDGTSDLDKDVAFVNAFYSDDPQLEAPPDDIDANRAEYRSRQDAAADSGDGDFSVPEDPESRRMDFAFQSMNIMGQVLRNFPTDLRADLKLALMQESYSLGLRTLRVFLGFLNKNAAAFRRDMFQYFKMLQPFSRRPDDEIQAAADRAVRGFAELVLFGSLKQISNSVGSEELRDTYETVRKGAGEDHVPTRMIDLAIKLDHFAQIPESDVEELKQRLKANPAVYTILRLLVGEFLYLFPVDHRIRQRMIKLLDFQPGATTLAGPKKIRRLTTGVA